ncbi:DNA-binding protein [Escherichia coli O26:H11 str. 2011C-3274]|nr:DNA-binding protein [Escherichia coli O26:H11 str. 2011C-3274]
MRQRQHRAKVRQNPQQRALRQRQNVQRILHPPWRLRMRARRKRGEYSSAVRPTALPSHRRQRQKPLRPRMTWLTGNTPHRMQRQDRKG